MKHNYENITPQPESDPLERFFRTAEVPRTKSKEEVWPSLESKLSARPRRKIVSMHRVIYAAAASLVLLIGVGSFLRFYENTIYCPKGQHLTHVLPDGSTIDLNADSKISYPKFWWQFSRTLSFEGEAYFIVEKGKKFTVSSELGKTEVLGTRFNIYSRGDDYEVTCLTGQVKVTSFTAAEVVLSPEYTARISEKGEILMKKETRADEAVSWTSRMFRFTSQPLSDVLAEIGRQYNVGIFLKSPVDFVYTGYFAMDRPVEEILNLVCKPFGLNFARINEAEFEVYQN